MAETVAEKKKSSRSKTRRPWSVTTAGILLIIQAVFLFSLFPILVGNQIYRMPDAKLAWLLNPQGGLAPLQLRIDNLRQLQITLIFDAMTIPVPARLVTSLAFFILSLPVLLNGFLFLRIWRHAWTLAVFWEGTILALALFIYFNYNHPYIYLLMLSGIFMIFYLNTYEVQRAFPVFVARVEKKS